MYVHACLSVCVQYANLPRHVAFAWKSGLSLNFLFLAAKDGDFFEGADDFVDEFQFREDDIVEETIISKDGEVIRRRFPAHSTEGAPRKRGGTAGAGRKAKRVTNRDMEVLIHAAIASHNGMATTDMIRDEVEPYGWGLANVRGEPLASTSGRNIPFFAIISLLHSRTQKVSDNLWALRPQDRAPSAEEVARIQAAALQRIEERRSNGEDLYQEKCAWRCPFYYCVCVWHGV